MLDVGCRFMPFTATGGGGFDLAPKAFYRISALTTSRVTSRRSFAESFKVGSQLHCEIST